MHILSSNPVISTCCGMTACMKCFIFEIVGEKSKDDELKCCFCNHPIDIMYAENTDEKSIPANATNKSRLLPNMRIGKLMTDQLK